VECQAPYKPACRKKQKPVEALLDDLRFVPCDDLTDSQSELHWIKGTRSGNGAPGTEVSAAC
jgi:hypothetical protein